MEAQITVVLYVDGAPIAAGGEHSVVCRHFPMWLHFSVQRYLWASLIGPFPMSTFRVLLCKSDGWDVVMRGVRADIFWENAKGIVPKIINGIEEVPVVMAACIGELHQRGHFHVLFLQQNM